MSNQLRFTRTHTGEKDKETTNPALREPKLATYSESAQLEVIEYCCNW